MLSAIILTKNEEENIERCLKSLDFCEEIVVVDDYSTDKTIEKIQSSNFKFQIKSKIQIFKRKLDGNFSRQRNFGMEKARGDWIFFVDADEEVSKDLEKEIKRVMSYELGVKRERIAYNIKRRDYFWGRELRYGETAKIRKQGLIRLIRRNSGKWLGKVHEEFKVTNSKFKVQNLNSYINHYPHQTIKEFIQQINFYSTLRAKELHEKKYHTNIFEIIFYPLGKFIYGYFMILGFLDGQAGFVYAFLMSFHSFLVRSKLFLYGR